MKIAKIREEECIGCTKCIQACPVDAIMGAAKQMHTVLSNECTGCELCVEPCPVDCIDIIPLSEPLYNKERAQLRYQFRKNRLESEHLEKKEYSQVGTLATRKATVLAAIQRVKAKKIFERFQQANNNPTTELKYQSPFELLIAVILSAQATDVSVNKATQKLFAVANTPKKILALKEEGLKKYIKTIGLYNAKASNIIKTCRILLEKHHANIPDNRADLEALPGVGRKTANVILNTLFKQPVIAVDTHIFRVANRTGLAAGKTPLTVEKKLTEIIPENFKPNAHHWLVLHGRYVCLARQPHCSTCLINDLCEYPHKTVT